MDKIAQYEAIIINLLNDEITLQPETDLKEIVLCDKEKHHYQLIRVGWTNPKSFNDTIVYHFHIADNGKVWLLQNNTDNPVTNDLMRLGIPNTDIVLGFHPPQYRPYTGFAVE